MIQVRNLSKAYGSHVLLEGANFRMNPGERLGLVGRNGHGKTTLFRILLGVEKPDEGQVVIPRHYRLGHLSQHLEFHHPTVLEEACSALPQSQEGTDLRYRAEAALLGLGFEKEVFERSPQELSGGYQVRLNLAKVLISEPNLLLLDEPTNYLDIVSMRWVQRFLQRWPGELIVITHDREFMDTVTTHTMAIHRSGLRKVEGGTRKIEEQIAQEEEIHEKTRLNQERDRRQQEEFVERFRAKASKAKSVQSRIKRLEKMDGLEQLEQIQDLSFRFRATPFPAKQILHVDDLSFHYPGGPMLISGLSLRVAARDRIAVIGRNGRGKTTLLALLAGVLQPVSGAVRPHPKAEAGYFGQSNVDRLDPEKTIEQEIISVHPEHSRGEARSICGLMMFDGDRALKKVSVLSGGERSRVLLGKLLVSPTNLLFLDEPTNHLDMQSSEGLMHALKDFSGAVVMVTHSEMILRQLANRLVVFDGGTVRLFEGSYQDFLERVGWADEESSQSRPAASNSKGGKNRKELRRRRAEIINQRSRKLNPLRKKIQQAEEKILAYEGEIEQVDVLLCEAANRDERGSLSELARKRSSLKGEVQRLFEELESLTVEHDRREREFRERLSETG